VACRGELSQNGGGFIIYGRPYTVDGLCGTLADVQDHTVVPPFPVVGEITEDTWDQVADGQPVLLVRNGRPAAVIVDLESWTEAELAVAWDVQAAGISPGVPPRPATAADGED
jgi:antitoxin (DNA-binding transcriptional repressor) of toxin-antitoxin stability system